MNNKIMQYNYHTHTTRCGHAEGTDEEYVLTAIDNGFKEIAFTDHSPWVLHKSENGRIRMSPTQFEEYYTSIKALQTKYQDQISIKIGLECEYFADRIDWLKQLIKDYKLDIIVFGNHFYKEITNETYFGRDSGMKDFLNKYLESTIAGLETGIYRIFAHPDLFMNGYKKWDEETERISRAICRKANECEVVLEYNLGGVRQRKYSDCYYPCEEFWQIAKEEGCKAIVGIDAHSPRNYGDQKLFREAYQYLDNLGIEVVGKLDF